MLLNLSETYSDSIALDLAQQVCCDFCLSNAVLETTPEEAPKLFAFIQDRLPLLWQHLTPQLPENPWIQALSQPSRLMNFSLIVVTNPEIHQLNRDFRQKDQATDVLTFTLLEDASTDAGFHALPELNMGEIYVSLDWARETVCKNSGENPQQTLNFFDDLTLFLLERMVHGCLHLLGVHHDTMTQYDKVVAIQKRVMEAIGQGADRV